jgi:hypothetical protein
MQMSDHESEAVVEFWIGPGDVPMSHALEGEAKRRGMSSKRISLHRAIDLMRIGSVLIKQHNEDGTMGHYLSPGGYVEPTVAEKLKRHPLIHAGSDGIWPGLDQTWKLGVRR